VTRSTAEIAARIDAAFAEGLPGPVAAAIGEAVRAQGVAKVARDSRLRRESLYKTLSPDGNPELATLLSVLSSIGFGLKLRRLSAEQRHRARLGSSRLRQLQADLVLSAEERVRAAAATAAAVPHRKGSGSRVVGFERFEDYLDWKEREGIRR
jgi:probable addiction module antidote protein